MSKFPLTQSIRGIININNIIALALCLTSLGCGAIPLGSAGPGNDTLPTGTLLAQGQFFGMNGNTVSGSAQIYFSSGSYVLSMVGISFPDASSLTAKVYISNPSKVAATVQLISTAGTNNYPFSSQSGLNSFAQVLVLNTPNNQNFASAQLTSTTRTSLPRFFLQPEAILQSRSLLCAGPKSFQ